jgi:hypothetical protein
VSVQKRQAVQLFTESLFLQQQDPAIRVSLPVKPLIPQAKPHRRRPTMRLERTIRASIFYLFADHEIGCELKAMSRSDAIASRWGY